MAFDLDTSNPTNSYDVASYPANERAHRTAVSGLVGVEHSATEGRHKFGMGNSTARDAISTWVAGSIWFNTGTSPAKLQLYTGSAWVDVGTALDGALTTSALNAAFTLSQNASYLYWSAANSSEQSRIRFNSNSGDVIGIGQNNNQLVLYGASVSLKDKVGGTTLGTVWHSGNDGSGSGLDADTVRGSVPLASGDLDISGGNFTLKAKSSFSLHGNTASLPNNAITSVSFGRTFSTQPLVLISVEHVGAVLTGLVVVDGVTTTGFTAKNPNSQSVTIHWIAIGPLA